MSSGLMRWDSFMSSRSAGLTIFLGLPPRVPLTPQPAFAAPWALHMSSLRDSTERLNGILKQEYGLGGCFQTKAQARQAVEQAVWLYNELRPHLSLNYQTPSEVHEKAA